jgi:hypothetical protein
LEPVVFCELPFSDKIHYVLGLGFFSSKQITILLFKLGFYILKQAFFFAGWSFRILNRGAAFIYNSITTGIDPNNDDIFFEDEE